MEPKITVQVVNGKHLEHLLQKIEVEEKRKLKDILILPNSSAINLYTVIWEKRK